MRIPKLAFIATSVFVLTLFAQTAQAQLFTITCSASDTVRQGAAILLNYSFENVSAASFRAPEIEGLILLNGPSRRSQVSIVNGKRSSAEALGYYYLAETVGTINVPAVELDAAAGGLRTEALSFYITADPGYVSRQREMNVDPNLPTPAPAPKRRPTVKM